MVLLPVLCRRFAFNLDAKFLMMCEYFFVQGTMFPMLWLAQEAGCGCCASVGSGVGLVGAAAGQGRVARGRGGAAGEGLRGRGGAGRGVRVGGARRELGVSVWYIVPGRSWWCWAWHVVSRGWGSGRCREMVGQRACGDLPAVDDADMFVFYHVMGNMMQGCLSVASFRRRCARVSCLCVLRGVWCAGEAGGGRGREVWVVFGVRFLFLFKAQNRLKVRFLKFTFNIFSKCRF